MKKFLITVSALALLGAGTQVINAPTAPIRSTAGATGQTGATGPTGPAGPAGVDFTDGGYIQGYLFIDAGLEVRTGFVSLGAALLADGGLTVGGKNTTTLTGAAEAQGATSIRGAFLADGGVNTGPGSQSNFGGFIFVDGGTTTSGVVVYANSNGAQTQYGAQYIVVGNNYGVQAGGATIFTYDSNGQHFGAGKWLDTLSGGISTGGSILADGGFTVGGANTTTLTGATEEQSGLSTRGLLLADGGATVQGAFSSRGHILSNAASVPTVGSFHANFGSVTASSVVGGDNAGIILFTTGTASAIGANAALMTVTLNVAYASANYACVVQSATASGILDTSAYYCVPNAAGTFIVYNVSGFTPANSTAYKLQYMTMGAGIAN